VYDFDLAVAPSTCNENMKENLGLGFCPYEDIGKIKSTLPLYFINISV